VELHWLILSYSFFIPVVLRISILFTVINIEFTLGIDQHLGQINRVTSGVALTSCFREVSLSWIALLSSMLDPLSPSLVSSISLGKSKFPIQLIPCSVSETESHQLFSSCLVLSQWIVWILLKIDIRVCAPGRSFAHKAGNKCDVSDNQFSATQSGWKFLHDALTINFLIWTLS